jgi:RND superfamily putative drug exporter
MFARWGGLVVRTRWTVLVAAVVLMGIAATWGAGVFAKLVTGGFLDRDTPSGQARAAINATFGAQDPDVFVLYSSSTLRVTDSAFRTAVEAALAAAARRPEVTSVITAYTTPPAVAATLVSRDGHETYAVIRLRPGDDDHKLNDYRAVKSLFAPPAASGVTTRYGGLRSFYDDINVRTKSDIERAETLSTPILLILLVIIFRSVIAAVTPLVVGALAIVGGFAVVRLLTMVTTVSTFAINIITLIGLGLAIDYSLFMVSRFREELARGHAPPEAVVRTMATAGRTVAVSGITVTVALAGLLLFPQTFLRSMGYGAMSAVLVAVVAALSVLPAGLAVLGGRINALRVPLPRRKRAADADGAERGGWARLAHSVMRRPWAYLVGVLAVLAVLAAPVTHIRFGGLDTRVLPPSAPSRQVADILTRDFPAVDGAPIQVLVSAGASAVPAVVDQIRRLPAVTAVTPTASRGDATLLTVDYRGLPTGGAAKQTVAAIRALRPPDATVAVTGGTADLVDQLHGLGAQLPWMALFVVVATSVLLFLAFGSVLLPIKAVIMNVVSLGAAFGVVVFIFQDGHFASLLRFTATGVIEPTDPILMIVVLFGLATDYEVFLLSRIREEWDTRTAGPLSPGSAGAANTASVAAGLQRTGRIITSAALLLVIVVVGFAAGDIGFVKLIGVGMIVAIAVDATLVRALLVPATMRLLGRWNWWAPGPLGRVYRRYGIREAAAPAPVRPQPATAEMP